MPPEDQKAISVYELDDHIVSVTTKTLDILFSSLDYQDALILYFFYIKTSKIQRSVNVWAGNDYVMKQLRWGKPKLFAAKNALKNLNLIENVISRDKKGIIQKYYIKVKFIWSPVVLKPSGAENQTLAASTPVQDEYYKNNIKRVQNDEGGESAEGKENVKMNLFLEAFNSFFNSHYRATAGRERKLALRLKSFTMDQIMEALKNLAASPWHRGENDRGWVADPDFLLRNDEQIDKWLQKKAVSESASFSPLSDLEIWETAGFLDVPLSTVRDKAAEILRMVESGEIKKYPYAKNTKDTLIRWISSARDAGRIARMNEVERIDYPNKHPDVLARYKKNAELAQDKGWV